MLLDLPKKDLVSIFGTECDVLKCHSEQEWLERRRQYICGSEAADIIGCGFKSNIDVYKDKTGSATPIHFTPEMEKIYNTVLKAHEAGKSVLKAGISGFDADKAARDVIVQAGYGEYFSHSLGHGVGIEIHESPRLSQKSTDILQVGDIVTVEPGIYIEGFCGVRIENMCVVTRDGYKDLTVSDKKLIKL
jgi:hypothetical protein